MIIRNDEYSSAKAAWGDLSFSLRGIRVMGHPFGYLLGNSFSRISSFQLWIWNQWFYVRKAVIRRISVAADQVKSAIYHNKLLSSISHCNCRIVICWVYTSIPTINLQLWQYLKIVPLNSTNASSRIPPSQFRTVRKLIKCKVISPSCCNLSGNVVKAFLVSWCIFPWEKILELILESFNNNLEPGSVKW